MLCLMPLVYKVLSTLYNPTSITQLTGYIRIINFTISTKNFEVTAWQQEK